MPVVLAENFQFDNTESFSSKYPGTHGVVFAETGENAYFELNDNRWMIEAVPTEGASRIEIRIGFQPVATEGSTHTNTFSLFGLVIGAPTNTSIAINGTTVELADGWDTATYLHLILEGNECTILSDAGLKEKVIVGPWTLTNSVDATGWRSTNNSWFPRRWDYLVVAHNTPAGTMLTNLELEAAELTATNEGEWGFSNLGYVEDTNKDLPGDPPYVHSFPEKGVLKFSTVNEYQQVQWTVSGRRQFPPVPEEPILLRTNDKKVSIQEERHSQVSFGANLQVEVERTHIIAQPDFSRARGLQTPMDVTNLGIKLDDFSNAYSSGNSSGVVGSFLGWEGSFPRDYDVYVRGNPTTSIGQGGSRPAFSLSSFQITDHSFCLEFWFGMETIPTVAGRWYATSLSSAIGVPLASILLGYNYTDASNHGIVLFGEFLTPNVRLTARKVYKATLCYKQDTNTTWGYLDGERIAEAKVITLPISSTVALSGPCFQNFGMEVGNMRLTRGSSVYDPNNATIPFDPYEPFPLP